MGFLEDASKLLSYDTNNLWLGTNIDDDFTIDPSEGPEDDTLNITMRTLGVTFETIYKNIASYPNTIDTTLDNVIIKKYFLENDKLITITTTIEDTNDLQRITTILEGDTSLNYPIKRVKEIQNNFIKTIYMEIK